MRVWFNDKIPTVQDCTASKPVFCLKDFDLNVKRDFMPVLNDQSIETYTDLVKADIEILKNHSQEMPFQHLNMTHEEIIAVNELKQNHDLTIKPTDKGGGVVAMDNCDHITEALRQLNDCEVYRLLPGDQKWEFERKIKQMVDEALDSGLIDLNLSQFLIINSPQTPVLYLLPTIHKTLVNSTGRPIVSGRESIFNHICIFLDKILRPYATNAKSLIYDSTDFLEKIHNLAIPQHDILGSFDIISLYTSIEDDFAIEAVRACLEQSQFDNHGRQFVIDL